MSMSVRRPVLKPIIDDSPIKPIPVDNKPPETKPIQQSRTQNMNLFS